MDIQTATKASRLLSLLEAYKNTLKLLLDYQTVNDVSLKLVVGDKIICDIEKSIVLDYLEDRLKGVEKELKAL